MLARGIASIVLIAVVLAVGLAVTGNGGGDTQSDVTEVAAVPAADTGSDTDPADSADSIAPAALETSIDDESASEAPDATEAAAAPVAEAPPVLGESGELRNIDSWLQSDISSLDDLDGTVHVVQFWTFGCYNCKNTLPNLIELSERHAADEFTIVGVHAPEFEYERDPANIEQAAVDLGVTWPIAIDNQKTNFREWQGSRRFWPRTYVIDQNGDIRFDRIGEGAYDELNETVAYLIDNPPAAQTG